MLVAAPAVAEGQVVGRPAGYRTLDDDHEPLGVLAHVPRVHLGRADRQDADELHHVRLARRPHHQQAEAVVVEGAGHPHPAESKGAENRRL